MKICSKCNKNKTLREFYRDHRNKDVKYRAKCKECLYQESIQWYNSNKDKAKSYSRKFYNSNKDKEKLRTLKYRIEIKEKVFRYYGGRNIVCKCCKEYNLAFLTLDHINGGGNKHRKKLNVGPGHGFYLWIIKNNFPKGFQVLCYNCNCGKRATGICPHKNNE